MELLISGMISCRDSDSGEDFVDDFSVNVGQAIISALEAIGESFVVEPKLVEHGWLAVVYVHLVFDDVVANFVRLAVEQSGLDAAAGHPHGVGIDMMISADCFA